MPALTSSTGGGGGGATGGGVETIFNRRIEFHPARKPYSAVSSAGQNGFYLETLNPSAAAAAQKRPHDLAFGAESASGAPAKRVEGAAEFYEHGLDQELGFRITFRRIGAGLANLGNTCFLNSVLQCLTYTEPFAAYLQSGKHKTSCRTAGFCALCALQNHVMNALQSTGKIVSPLHLVRNLRCISRNFRNSRQEDAHEYMVNLLESMHKCCLPSGVPSESPSAYEKSLVHKIFGGRLRSQVKCTQCQFCSNKYDPFLDLSLEIAKAETLRKALLNFTAVEKLDGGEKQYQCQRCKQKVRALKQLTIHKPPHVLTVHLKRFSAYIPGQKIDKKVEFEPFLDLKPFVSDPNEANLKYVLYGVLVHAGWSTHSGHYYCFVRTSSGMWHSLDDNQVRQVSEKTVLSQKAYMLFYVRDRGPVKNSPGTIQKQNPGANTFGGKSNNQSTTLLDSGNAPAKNAVDIIQKQNPGANTFEGKNKNQRTTPLDGGNALFRPADTMKLNSNSNASGSQIPAFQNGNPLHVQKSLDLQSNGNSDPATSKDTAAKDLSQFPPVTGSIVATTIAGNSSGMVSEVLVEQPQKKSENVVEIQKVKDECNASYCLDASAQDVPQVDAGSVNASSKPESVEVASKGDVTSAKLELRAASNGADTSAKPELKEVTSNVLTKDQNLLQASSVPKCDPPSGKLKTKEKVNGDDTNPVSQSLHPPAASITQSIENKIHGKVEMKSKKLVKLPAKIVCSARNSLFVHTLRMQKNKKFQKAKRRRLASIEGDKIESSDQHASTSASSNGHQAVVKEEKSHRRKQPKSSKVKDEGEIPGINVLREDLKSIRSESHANTGRTVPLLAANNTINKENEATQKRGSYSFLMQGLRETTVPSWDDIESPKVKMRDVEHPKRKSIGYVLDEWDEEYDRGRRKKVKQSQVEFGGPNPFQETAEKKIRKLKTRFIRSGNKPFRN